MGYATLQPPQKTHRSNSVCLEKSASGDFFENAFKTHQENRLQPLKTRQKFESTSTKTALGVLFEHYRYTAFGEVEIYSPTGAKLAVSAIDNTVMWNSRRYDADSGLYSYWFRMYKADYGQWMSRDPIEEHGGINLYGFVENMPLNYWDGYGLALSDCVACAKHIAKALLESGKAAIKLTAINKVVRSLKIAKTSTKAEKTGLIAAGLSQVESLLQNVNEGAVHLTKAWDRCGKCICLPPDPQAVQDELDRLKKTANERKEFFEQFN